MKRWTKTAIRQMKAALDWSLHSNRPIAPAFGPRLGEREDFTTHFRAWFEEPGRRAAIIVSHFRGLESLMRDRAQSDRKTVEHAQANPHVWGKGTDEIVERFSRLARESGSAAEKIADLVARIEAEGLPPEVEAYDPTESRP